MERSKYKIGERVHVSNDYLENFAHRMHKSLNGTVVHISVDNIGGGYMVTFRENGHAVTVHEEWLVPDKLTTLMARPQPRHRHVNPNDITSSR